MVLRGVEQRCRIQSCCCCWSLQKEVKDNFALEKVKVSSSYPIFSPICCCKYMQEIYYTFTFYYISASRLLCSWWKQVASCEKLHRAQCCIFNTVKGISKHSSEIRGLCSIKSSSKMLQNLLYVMLKEIHVYYFISRLNC